MSRRKVLPICANSAVFKKLWLIQYNSSIYHTIILMWQNVHLLIHSNECSLNVRYKINSRVHVKTRVHRRCHFSVGSGVAFLCHMNRHALSFHECHRGIAIHRMMTFYALHKLGCIAINFNAHKLLPDVAEYFPAIRFKCHSITFQID